MMDRRLLQHSRRISLLAFALSLILGSHVHAQRKHVTVVHDTVAEKAIKYVDEHEQTLLTVFINSLSDRNGDFNQHLMLASQLRPLETENLDSSRIPSSIEAVGSFMSYIDEYMASGVALAHRLQDSIDVLRAMLPVSQQKHYLQPFIVAYTSDIEGFRTYGNALKDLYREVLDMLGFMRHAHCSVVEGKLQFSDKQNFDEYQVRRKKLDALTKAVSVAREESQKATDSANKKIQSAYGKKK